MKEAVLVASRGWKVHVTLEYGGEFHLFGKWQFILEHPLGEVLECWVLGSDAQLVFEHLAHWLVPYQVPNKLAQKLTLQVEGMLSKMIDAYHASLE